MEYKLPEAIDSKGDSYSERAYAEGWNACRAEMLASTPPAPQAERKPLFADLIANHDGLAEELKAIDAQIDKEHGQASVVQQEPVAWKHDCAALLTNDVELWIDACPHCGKPRNAPPPAQQAKTQPDPLHDDIQSVLFEVEQAIQNGCCPWQIEAAFEAYEAARRLQQPAHGIQGS